MSQRLFTTRNLTQEQVVLAVEWAKQEGWNPGLFDADCYYSVDPKGFLGGFLGDELIATISVVKYDDSFGFLGFYIVKPEYRGQGFGIQTWKAGMDYLKGYVIGLDGVLDQQKKYEKSGFKLAYQNIRYKITDEVPFINDPAVVNLNKLPVEQLELYDRSFFPADRMNFINKWIDQPNSHGLGVMSDQLLAGYGVIRKCQIGYKIGPLYADKPEQANSLLSSLVQFVQSAEPVYLDVPEVNSEAVLLAEKYRMEATFKTLRMYLGRAPEISVNRTYGVTSFELG